MNNYRLRITPLFRVFSGALLICAALLIAPSIGVLAQQPSEAEEIPGVTILRELGEFPTPQCFEVYLIENGYPHIEYGNEFCVTRDDDENWELDPGAGMDEWNDGNPIPLEQQGESGVFFFEVEIDPHAPLSGHEPRHPDWMLNLRPSQPSQKATIEQIGPPGGTLHGGTAHAR